MTEYFDVLDKNGNPLGYTKPAGEEFSDGEYQLGASLWIANPDGRLLIQKRAAAKKTAPGLWSLTGGKVQAGESSTAACLRETWEEIGLALSERDLRFLYRSTGTHMLFDDYITVLDFSIDNAVLLPSEVSEIRWSDTEEITRLYRQGMFLYNRISDLSKVQDYLSLHLPPNSSTRLYS